MSLYLAIFDENEEELDGVEIGSYADFNYFREVIHQYCEKKIYGEYYPNLLLHVDNTGEWDPLQAIELKRELNELSSKTKSLPPIEFNSQWQNDIAKKDGNSPSNLYECLFDVDGTSLIERLEMICETAITEGHPIEFQ